MIKQIFLHMWDWDDFCCDCSMCCGGYFFDYDDDDYDYFGVNTSHDIFPEKENTHKPSYTWQKTYQKRHQKKINEIFYNRQMTKNGIGYSLFDEQLSKIDKNVKIDCISNDFDNVDKCSAGLSIKPTICFIDVVKLLDTCGELLSKKYCSGDNVIRFKYLVPLAEKFGDGFMVYWFNTPAQSRLKNQSGTIQKISRKSHRHSHKHGNSGKTKNFDSFNYHIL